MHCNLRPPDDPLPHQSDPPLPQCCDPTPPPPIFFQVKAHGDNQGPRTKFVVLGFESFLGLVLSAVALSTTGNCEDGFVLIGLILITLYFRISSIRFEFITMLLTYLPTSTFISVLDLAWPRGCPALAFVSTLEMVWPRL